MIIIGLGNHEKQYGSTRHNIGFDTLDRIYSKNPWKMEDGYLYKYSNKLEALLIKPITGMNVCGPVIKKICEGLQGEHEIVVVYDDMDFEPGQMKIKVGGGDGKHNGVKSLIKHIGPDFTRIRVGIGKPKTKEQGIDFVLEPFTKPQRAKVDTAIQDAIGALHVISKENVQSAMSFFNRRDKDE